MSYKNLDKNLLAFSFIEISQDLKQYICITENQYSFAIFISSTSCTRNVCGISVQIKIIDLVNVNILSHTFLQ